MTDYIMAIWQLLDFLHSHLLPYEHSSMYPNYGESSERKAANSARPPNTFRYYSRANSKAAYSQPTLDNHLTDEP